MSRSMQIRIDYNEAYVPIDTKDADQPERILDEMLGIYTKPEVPHIINEALRTFRALCDAWNQRELAERRAAGIEPPRGEG